MSDCISCKSFITCQESIQAFEKAKEIYPGTSIEVGKKRAEYMYDLFEECKNYEEL